MNLTLKKDHISGLSKKDIISHAAGIAEAELETSNPLLMMAALKKYKVLIDELLKNIDSAALDEADKYGRMEKIEMAGCKISKSEGGSPKPIYDYRQDMVYAEMEDKLSARRKALDLVIETSIEVADTDTGGIIPKLVPAGMTKGTKRSVRFTF